MKFFPLATMTSGLFFLARGQDTTITYCNADVGINWLLWNQCCYSNTQHVLNSSECQEYDTDRFNNILYHACDSTGPINYTDTRCHSSSTGEYLGNYIGDLQITMTDNSLETIFSPVVISAENMTSAVCETQNNYYNIYINTTKNILPCVISDDSSENYCIHNSATAVALSIIGATFGIIFLFSLPDVIESRSFSSVKFSIPSDGKYLAYVIVNMELATAWCAINLITGEALLRMFHYANIPGDYETVINDLGKLGAIGGVLIGFLFPYLVSLLAVNKDGSTSYFSHSSALSTGIIHYLSTVYLSGVIGYEIINVTSNVICDLKSVIIAASVGLPITFIPCILICIASSPLKDEPVIIERRRPHVPPSQEPVVPYTPPQPTYDVTPIVGDIYTNRATGQQFFQGAVGSPIPMHGNQLRNMV